MPLRKIIVGVPTYARTYNLVVPIGQNMINVPARGPGIGKGKLNYTQVCEFLKLPETSKQYDYYSQVPYAYRGFDWISYENERSVAIKAQWVVKTGMGGIVTFALNFDDTKGRSIKVHSPKNIFLFTFQVLVEKMGNVFHCKKLFPMYWNWHRLSHIENHCISLMLIINNCKLFLLFLKTVQQYIPVRNLIKLNLQIPKNEIVICE